MSVEADLQDLANTVRKFNPEAAERLESLSMAMGPDGDSTGWAGVDVFHAIDPTGIVAPVRSRPMVDHSLAQLERWRNVLALAPVLLTWIGLIIAGIGYRVAVEADPALLERPFLLLWEEGFLGHLPVPFSLFSLSRVALLDATLLLLLLYLTWRIHGKLNVSQAKHETYARQLEASLHQAVWRASLVLAAQSSQPAMVDRFRDATDGLLNELRAERARIEQLANQREREMADLRRFASGLKHGASDLLRFSGEVKGTFSTLIQVSTVLDERIAQLTDRHARLEAVLVAVGSEMTSHNHVHKTAADQLEVAARLMVESADRSAAVVSGVADTISQLRAELADIRQQFIDERVAYQSAAKAADQSAYSLLKALQSISSAVGVLEQASKDMQSLLAPLSTVPANLVSAVHDQAVAAADIVIASQQMASTFTKADERLSGSADALSRSAGALSDLISTIQSLTNASAALQQQARSILDSAPTKEAWVQAWREVQREWRAESGVAQGSDGKTPTDVPQDTTGSRRPRSPHADDGGAPSRRYRGWFNRLFGG